MAITQGRTIPGRANAAAAEGFINELAELCDPILRDYPLPGRLADFAQIHRELEESHGSTQSKYLMASFVLDGKILDKGANPYQDFADLFRLRDLIMHLRAIDQAGKPDGEAMSFTMPKLVVSFQQRKLAKASTPDLGMSWLSALQTPAMAAWACDSALNIMLALLDMIPDCPGDPSAHFRSTLRRFKHLP
jgi:hypothetical protein